MKLNAVAVGSSDIKKALEFYSLIGFKLPEFKERENHYDSIDSNGIKLMIDSKKLITKLNGVEPIPRTTFAFTIEFDSKEIDEVALRINNSECKLYKEPGRREIDLQDTRSR